MKTRLIISERWMTTILTVILIAMPQLVWGQLMNMAGYNETDFNVAPQQAFSWTSKGPGCIHLKLMVGAHDSDWEWRLRNGYFYVKDENGKDIDCVFLNDNVFNYSWNYSWAYVANCNLSASKLFNTNNRSYNTWYINQAQNNPVYITYTKIADQSGYMELDWYYPVEFAGKTLKWFVRGSIAEDINNKETVTMDYSKSLGTIEFDEISLETYDPIPGIEAADYGYLKIPVSCDRKIKKLEGTYLDSLNVEHKLEDVELEKSSSMAFLRVGFPSHAPRPAGTDVGDAGRRQHKTAMADKRLRT